MTLDRVISRLGLASRTVATEWIRAGRVRVNGRVEKNAEHWVHLQQDRIQVDGRDLSEAKRVYVMLNKPTGVITSYGDPQERKTVYDHLQEVDSWIFPVGRLDKDTSGLLLLTNDTEFGDRLTDPQSKVPKCYRVKVDCLVSEPEIARLRQGIEIEPGVKTLPCMIRRVRDSEKYSWLEITITEGKNRQIRRMLEALGHRVLKLVRIRLGNLSLVDLVVGKWRMLTRREVEQLWR